MSLFDTVQIDLNHKSFFIRIKPKKIQFSITYLNDFFVCESNKCGKPIVIHRDKNYNFCILILVCSSLHHSLSSSPNVNFLILNSCQFFIFFVVSCFMQFVLLFLCEFENELINLVEDLIKLLITTTNQDTLT